MFLSISYQIMLDCWRENPVDRPTFERLRNTMKTIERNHKVRRVTTFFKSRALYSWNMVNLFSCGCHVIDRAYVRTYASTDCKDGVEETIKRAGGVSQACLGKSTYIGHLQNGQLTAVKTG